MPAAAQTPAERAQEAHDLMLRQLLATSVYGPGTSTDGTPPGGANGPPGPGNIGGMIGSVVGGVVGIPGLGVIGNVIGDSVANNNAVAAANEGASTAPPAGDTAVGVADGTSPVGGGIDGGNAGAAAPGGSPAADGDAGDAGWKDGGKIDGAGSGTSDSNSVRVSDNEYIMPADVVRKLGVEFFDQIRDKFHTPTAGGGDGFKDGGVVDGAPAWEAAEQVAKNAEGKHQALIGGQWLPVEQAAKNAEGKFMVLRGKPAAKPNTAGALAKVAEDEPNAPLVQVGSAMMAPVEGAKQIYDHLTGKGKQADKEVQGRAEAMKALGVAQPLSRPVGTATDIVMGAGLPAIKAGGSLRSGALTGATYAGLQPVASGKDFASEKVEQMGTGAVVGGGLAAGIQSLLRGPGALKGLYEKFFGGPSGAPLPARGAGAEQVTTELQRQRDVMEGKAKVAQPGSESETAQIDFARRMEPIKDAAFNSGAKIDTADTVRVIDSLLLKNPDKQVQGALNEVKQTIARATKGAAAAGLPPAGSSMSAAQLRQMQGQSGQLDMNMADEVRQSINRLIGQSGDQALSKHTQDILTQVRDRMLQNAPAEYKTWIAEHAKGAQGMEKFKPDAGVLGRTTTDTPGVQALTAPDAQAKLEKIFSGPTAGRDVRDLLDRSRHDPQVREGLKRSVMEWVTPTGQTGKVNINTAASNWNNAKDAIREAQLFVPEHHAAIDKVMTDLASRETATAGAKATAGAVGSLFSYKGAIGARTAISALTRTEKTPQQVEEMVQKVMADPRIAGIAASAPTPENIRKLEQALAVGGSREMATQEPPRPRSRPNVLGMRPAGI